jgi:hypothetical protein
LGRKQEVQNPKFIGGDIEQEDWEELEKIRWREHKERTEILRIAIQEYVRNHAEGNSTFKLDNWNINPEFKAMPALIKPKEEWTEFLKENTDKKERDDILDVANHIVTTIKTINYWESKKEVDKNPPRQFIGNDY